MAGRDPRLLDGTDGRVGDGHLGVVGQAVRAMPRMIVMLLENHQQADGSVRLPAALQPFLGGRTQLSPV